MRQALVGGGGGTCRPWQRWKVTSRRAIASACTGRQRRLSSLPDSLSSPYACATTVVLVTSLPLAPQASAAGVRTQLLVDRLLRQTRGVESVHVLAPPPSTFSSSSKDKDETYQDEREAMRATQQALQELGIQFHVARPNRSKEMGEILQGLLPQTQPHATQQHTLPSRRAIFVFDRFHTEEMFSFEIHKYMPEALLVLDMQDFHSLRRARQAAVEASACATTLDATLAALECRPTANDPTLLRELGSIHRCDLVLACSSVEAEMLHKDYGVAHDKLVVAPLLGDLQNCVADAPAHWQQRRDLCFVGGYRHPPNIDAVDQLARLWPQIRPRLQAQQNLVDEPPPCLYILGAYCTKRLQQRWYQSLLAAGGTTEDVDTFRVEGFVPGPIHERLVRYRLLVAPLRYGAGLKGKLVDAWHAGLPVATTSIGAEGLWSETDTDADFPGGVADTDSSFINTVVDLYTRPDVWTLARQGLTEGIGTSWRTDLGAGAWSRIAGRLTDSLNRLSERRKKDYTRAMLWRESCRSTEYFSKYIEYKEMNPPRSRGP